MIDKGYINIKNIEKIKKQNIELIKLNYNSNINSIQKNEDNLQNKSNGFNDIKDEVLNYLDNGIEQSNVINKEEFTNSSIKIF